MSKGNQSVGKKKKEEEDEIDKESVMRELHRTKRNKGQLLGSWLVPQSLGPGHCDLGFRYHPFLQFSPHFQLKPTQVTFTDSQTKEC